ncbi:cytochrome P450 family protein [Hyalangium rubrum]|uniref:Cytochrome P450 n=1 Tax=Hyalangium rubrum TaxID=3103134 RepID=A0ABU5H1M6_9BACT|nr:cytochrome P450 [Hyalangium sp. s54d21]MDY7227206.1 cytochrome P450 [Hyalangium sp. s54d21]
MSTSAPRFDLWSEEARIDPLPILARMRREAPVIRLFNPHQGAPVWFVTRYKEAVEFLRDPRFIKDKDKLSAQTRRLYFRVNELSHLDQHMINADPPAHTRLRSLVAKAFTPRRVDDLRPRITTIVNRLLDGMQDKGSVDLLEAFAMPLPVTVIAELLGIPSEDHGRFREWVNILFTPPVGGDFEPLRRMAREFQGYLQEFLARRRAHPREDLTSALIAAEEQGDQLSGAELMSMVFLLLIAGYETTAHLLGNGVWALLRHPEQKELLRTNPWLIDSAVDEMLRYRGPVKNTTTRFPLQETEFGGQLIPAQEMVVASLLSADNDAEQFPEPERFDITRTPNRHIAFGAGVHFCLGGPLAKVEAVLAIPLLLERLPQLRFAVDPATLRWRTGILLHGLEQLPVAF